MVILEYLMLEIINLVRYLYDLYRISEISSSDKMENRKEEAYKKGGSRANGEKFSIYTLF